jgi:hypothetical protein
MPAALADPTVMVVIVESLPAEMMIFISGCSAGSDPR